MSDEIDEIRKLFTTYRSTDRFDPVEFGRVLIGQIPAWYLAKMPGEHATPASAPRARETSTPEWPGLTAELLLDDHAISQPDADDCAPALRVDDGFPRINIDYSPGGFAGAAWYIMWSVLVARHPNGSAHYRTEGTARPTLGQALAFAAEVITDRDRDTSQPTALGIEASDTATHLVTPLGWPAVGAVAYGGGWAPCRFANGIALVDRRAAWADAADAIWDAACTYPQDSDSDTIATDPMERA